MKVGSLPSRVEYPCSLPLITTLLASERKLNYSSVDEETASEELELLTPPFKDDVSTEFPQSDTLFTNFSEKAIS